MTSTDLARLALFTFATTLAGAATADGHPPPRPPAEAFAACASAREGDTCSVAMGSDTMTGVCASSPSDGLFCRPSGPPPGPPREAFDACAGSKKGDACTVRLGGESHAGTCDEPPGGGLACRPDDMPPPPR